MKRGHACIFAFLMLDIGLLSALMLCADYSQAAIKMAAARAEAQRQAQLQAAQQQNRQNFLAGEPAALSCHRWLAKQHSIVVSQSDP